MAHLSAVFDVVPSLTRLAGACPLCGAALALNESESTAGNAQRVPFPAQSVVLEHVKANHLDVLERWTVVDIAELAVAGANTFTPVKPSSLLASVG
jgi:hypothetical protein